MNRTTIISKVKALGFDKNEYWVIAGAALVLHGLRKETADIDLSCTKELFNNLLMQGHFEERNELGYRKVSLNKDIEVFEEWFVNGIILIEGIPTANLEGIKKMKIQMGRDKDIRDLKLIEDAQKTIEKI